LLLVVAQVVVMLVAVAAQVACCQVLVLQLIPVQPIL